jgi:hypothetical protein
MTQNMNLHFVEVERQLNEALRDVVLEIRSVALVDLASYIHADKLESLADIFDSAAELFFKQGTLLFSYSADLELRWLGVPVVSINLEFHCMDVSIFFKLEIASYSSRIKIMHATVYNKPISSNADTTHLQKAIAFSKIDQPVFVRSFGLH